MFNLQLDLHRGLSPSAFKTKILYAFLVSPMGDKYLVNLI
jgi:hypothetical protein